MTSTNRSGAARPLSQDSMLHFKPIEKTTIPGEIIDQIFSMLYTGKLKPGDRLPSERQLVELYKVGRNSVREALKALEALGVIRRETRGTIVCSLEENAYPALSLAASGAKFEHLMELSRILGIECAGLAAERATPALVKKMESVLRDTEDAQEAAVMILSFQRLLQEAAKNPALTYTSNMIGALLSRSDVFSSAFEKLEGEKLRNSVRNALNINRRILKAVKSRNANAARKHMREYSKFFEGALAV